MGEHGGDNHEEGKAHAHKPGGHGAPHGGSHEEHEGAPEWLISFADNTALMMGLFVIMLALNMGPKGSGGSDKGAKASDTQAASQDLDWIIGVRAAFNNPVSVNSKDPRDAPLVRRLREKTFGPLEEAGPAGNGEKLQSQRPTEYTDINATVAFDDNSPLLNSVAKDVVTDIAPRIRGLNWIVELRGHVSPTERLTTSDRGMSLAFERAKNVAYLLAAHGVSWDQLRVVACGDADRIVPRTYSASEDRPNQRVEVIITRELMSGDQFERDDGHAMPSAAKIERDVLPESKPVPRGEHPSPAPVHK